MLLTVAALFGQEALQSKPFGERRHASVIRSVVDGASVTPSPGRRHPNLHVDMEFCM
jgi:hypothetical protein